MGQFKLIKSKKSQEELLLNKVQEISFPDDLFVKAIDIDKVYVVEDFDFHPIKIIYTGETIKINFVFEDDRASKIELYKIFKEKYITPLSKVVNIFSKIPFVLFGEFVPGKKIVLFDMYINENWISYGDFLKIASETGLDVPRTLYHGLFDEKVIKKVMNSIDSEVYEGEKIKYVFIKSEMEARYGSRDFRLGALLSSWERPKNKKEKKEIENKAKSIISSYLLTEIGQPVLTKWKKHLENKKIPLISKNKGIILSEIVNWMLFEIEVDIYNLSEQHNIEEQIVKEAVKSCLPKFVIKMFNL